MKNEKKKDKEFNLNTAIKHMEASVKLAKEAVAKEEKSLSEGEYLTKTEKMKRLIEMCCIHEYKEMFALSDDEYIDVRDKFLKKIE